MKTNSLPILLVALLPLLGCQQEEETRIPAFDGNRAFKEVEALVQFSPRDAGTPGGKQAAEHIATRLKSFGIQTQINTFTAETPAGKKTMHNVISRIPGTTDRWIILGSHFDTMPGIENFQGANDSGSSTGILLEIARLSAKLQPKVGIIFAFFDGEEGIADYIPGDGLHGSRAMAQQLKHTGENKKINAMILLDMVGDEHLHFTVPYNSARNLVKELFTAAYATDCRNRISLSQGFIITDDHIPFLEVGIPAIDLIDFRFGSTPNRNDYWHTADDNLKNIRAESLEITGKLTLQLLKQLAF